jgi:hypothetical protein
LFRFDDAKRELVLAKAWRPNGVVGSVRGVIPLASSQEMWVYWEDQGGSIQISWIKIAQDNITLKSLWTETGLSEAGFRGGSTRPQGDIVALVSNHGVFGYYLGADAQVAKRFDFRLEGVVRSVHWTPDGRELCVVRGEIGVDCYQVIEAWLVPNSEKPKDASEDLVE